MKKTINLTFENEEKIFFETIMSKSGLSCLWELGACYNDRIGHSLIITDEKFKKTGAIFLKNDLHAQEEHALVPVAEGFYVFKSIYHKPDYTMYIYRINFITSILIQADLVGCSILATNDSEFLSKRYKNKNFMSAYEISLDKAEGEKILYCYPPAPKSNNKFIHHKKDTKKNDIVELELMDKVVKEFGGYRVK